MGSDPTGSGSDWAAPGSTTPPPGWSTEQPVPTPTATDGWGAPYAPPPPPRPGIVPLRPLGVGEILDGAFAAIRRYPKPTLGFAACVMLVVTSVQVVTEWYLLRGIEPPAAGGTLSDATDYLSRVGTVSVVSVVISALATLLLTGIVIAVIGDAVLGRRVSAADAWQRLRPVFARLIGLSFLTFLIWLAAAVPGIVIAIAGAVAGSVGLVTIGVILAIIGVVYVWPMFSLAPAALVLERQPVTRALRRSRELVRGNWWRVFLILLLAALIALIVNGIISLPFGLAGGGITSIGGRTTEVHFVQLLISGIGGLLASTVARPFSAGVAALLYIDRRMRAEALDLALARAAAESAPE
ncbi:MAG TPA: hypothetical protein VH274_02335 [Mycobacteriales bacterium]|jgi:hypothetical protein|nr:hypothetical protein [Mycobacteriales bacterium]